VRECERTARSGAAAERALAKALRDRARIDVSAEITGDTKLSVVAEAWWTDFQRKDRSPNTLQAYRDRIDKQIIPAVGNVRVREASVGLVDRHLRAVETKHGAALAKQTKTVLGQICALAVRHDADGHEPSAGDFLDLDKAEEATAILHRATSSTAAIDPHLRRPSSCP
jgi:hypothetical protein